MIHSLLDQIQPDASDEEDDERPEVIFLFQDKTPILASAADGAAAAIRAAAMGGGEDSVTDVGSGSSTLRPDDCKALVLCGIGAGTAYALSTFQQLRPAPWSLEVVKETAERMFPPPPRSPRFFTAGGKDDPRRPPVAVAVLDGPVPADVANTWSEVLLEAFSGVAEVIVLDRVYRSGWLQAGGQGRPQEPHLCGLWTSFWSESGPLGRQGSLAALPSPNALDGLSAALLTLCEAQQQKCLVALALQDGAHLGEGSLAAFQGLDPLVRRLALLGQGESDGSAPKKPNYSEAIRRVVPPPSMSIYA